MSKEHNHEHDHEHQPEYITLVNEEGDESLFEILLTIDGEDKFANKQYVLLFPAGFDEDENDEEIELLAYSFVESEDGLDGELEPIESDEEWDMIEEVFNAFSAEQEE